MGLRSDELDEALAWSELFCRVTRRLLLQQGGIETGAEQWRKWVEIVVEDRRLSLAEGDSEPLLEDYRFWRDGEPGFTAQ